MNGPALLVVALVALAAPAAAAPDCGDVPACARACAAGRAPTCLRAGVQQRDGLGTPVDPMKAVPLLERGCALGDGMACWDLAEMVDRGLGVRGAASSARALALYARSCALGEHVGCDMAAVQAPDERQGAVFTRRSVALDAQQCARRDADAYACYLLSLARKSGEGTAKDPAGAAAALARSVALDERGCAAGDRDACRRLAHEVDAARGRRLWSEALAADLADCQAGDAAMCMRAGSMISVGSSSFGSSPDPARAAELFGRACDAGWARGCRAAAADAQQAKAPPERVAELWDRACRAGDEEACDKAFAAAPGAMADRGGRALELRLARCLAGNARSCAEAGEQLGDGRGVPADTARAEKLTLRACQLGARWVCPGKRR